MKLLELLCSDFELPVCVALDDLHVGSLQSKRSCGNVLCDRRACARVCAVSYIDRRNKVCVAADEGIVAYCCAVLLFAVKVYGNYSAAEVYILADIAVAHIGKMCHAGILADCRVLDLNKVADLCALLNVGIGSELNEGSYLCIVIDLRIVCLNIIKVNSVPDNAVFNNTAYADLAVLTDRGLSSELNIAVYPCADTDSYLSAYRYTVGAATCQ